jgi:bacilliredoxin
MFNDLNGNTRQSPIYDPESVQPMRDELTWVGFEELLNPEQVDAAIQNQTGSVFVLINSVCGCAAGSARPGAAAALQHSIIPDTSVTVFAGQDRDAVDRTRAIFQQPPSSPCMGLIVDGKLEFFLPRHEIEGRSAEQIAGILTDAFDKHCKRSGPSVSKEKYDELVHARMCGSKVPKNTEV